jgi:adenosyl cobinamide kinase/adenosyl cobinamide phosphate guanylyltransferase
LVLVFGGAYQGKLDYALERFALTDSEIYECEYECTRIPCGKKIINGLEKWVLALISAGADDKTAVRQLIADNREAVVICTDISCGVVPADPVQRSWREAVGRALTDIAHESGEVVRLYCGIPTRLK